MRTLVSANEMRWCDESSIRRYGIPGLILMENAGRGVAGVALQHFGPLAKKPVLIFCGKGNNGGDGFVAARHLNNAGCAVVVILLGPARDYKGDARTNLRILEKIQKTKSASLTLVRFSPKLLKTLPSPCLIIDAIFGTGFNGSVRQPFVGVIDWINKQESPVLAVDIPSGVDGTTGAVVNTAVKASRTATFGMVKTGLLCNQGQDCVGEISLVDISMPKAVTESGSLKTFLLEAKDVAAAMPRRVSTANKYSVGKVFVLAGSKGFTGAAYLCARAALRMGAGAVVLGIPETIYSIVARRISEAIVTPLPATSDGTLAMAGFGQIEERLQWADVVAIGPGLSTNAETQELVLRILKNHSGQMVVDADALRAVARHGLSKLRRLKGEFILTPHAGEYSRLIDLSSKEIECSKIEKARSGALESHATIVLKGGPTVIGCADGSVYVNSTGNPGMATVGSGDVLTGMIAACWAQGMSQDASAYSGVYLHGLSGDCAGEEYGERSIVAHDLIDHLHVALKKVEAI